MYINCTPNAGKEQGGRRPAVVISPKIYNEKAGLVLCCPITTQQKGYPFEVALQDTRHIKGTVLTDQLRSMDWRERDAQFCEAVSTQTFRIIQQKLGLLINE